jgi:hypothetical protein
MLHRSADWARPARTFSAYSDLHSTWTQKLGDSMFIRLDVSAGRLGTQQMLRLFGYDHVAGQLVFLDQSSEQCRSRAADVVAAPIEDADQGTFRYAPRHRATVGAMWQPIEDPALG